MLLLAFGMHHISCAFPSLRWNDSNFPHSLRVAGGRVDSPLGDLSGSVVFLLSDSWDTACTGIVVGSRHVLTATHCLLKNKRTGNYSVYEHNPMSVYYDCKDGKLDLSANNCKSVKIDMYYTHPCYKMNGCGCREEFVHFEDDIAILRIADRQFSKNAIMLIDGVHGQVPDEDKATGLNATVLGYGATGIDVVTGMPITGTRLLQVVLPIASEAQCNESDWQMAASFEHTMCTGGVEGMAVCPGDSGGPVTVLSKGKVWVVGITSRISMMSKRCDEVGILGASVRTKAYGEWIRAVMGSVEWECPSCPCFSTPLSKAYGLETGAPMYVDEGGSTNTVDTADSSHFNPSVFVCLAFATLSLQLQR
jgi:secreted trypsin-like serine protease